MQITVPPLSTTIAALNQLATASTAVPVDVTVTATPPNVDQLLRQIQISGPVTAPPDNSDTITLATALGNFSFSLTQLPDNVKQQVLQTLENIFQTQKPVTAIIQPGSPPSEAVLLLPSTTTAAAAATQTSSTYSPQQLQTLTLSPGANLPAVVLPTNIVLPGSAANIPTNSLNATTQLPQSPVISASTVINLPASNASPGTTQSQTPIPQTTTNPLPQLAQQSSASPQPQSAASSQPLPPVIAQLLEPGKEVIVHVDTVSLANAPIPAPANANQIQATVVGNGANGQLIIRVADATLYIRANVEAPVGTNLLVTVEAQKSPNPTVLPPVPEQNFTSLQQVLTVLADANPFLAQQFTQTQIPQANAQLAAPLLFFLSALKQGDAKNWMGQDVIDTLTKAGKIELVTKLARDMNAATETHRDATVGEWKSYPVPLHNQGQIQTLTLHVHEDGKHHAEDRPSSDAPKQVRFLIDVRMSRLGPIQLDGLVRPRKLDMIIRSEGALPPGLPQDLRNTYLATIEAIGFTGGLSFQSGRQHWLVPLKQTPQSLVT